MTLWTYRVMVPALVAVIATLFWITMPMSCKAEAQTQRVGAQLGTYASMTLYVTVCHPEAASREAGVPRS